MNPFFNSISKAPLLLAPGQQVPTLPIGDCTALKVPPATVPFVFDWSIYGAASDKSIGAEIDIRNNAPAAKIDLVRSVYVDNSLNSTAVYIYFPDTQFTINVLPYSVVMSPAWTAGTIFQIFSTGFSDTNLGTTTVHISNSHVNAFNAIAANPVEPIKYIEYAGFVSSTINSYSQLFSNVPLGTKAASRINIFAMTHMEQGSFSYLTSASFNAAPLTYLGYVQSYATNIRTALFLREFNPLDTVLETANIIVNSSGAAAIPNLISINTYALYNLQGGGFPFAFKTAFKRGGAVYNGITLETPVNGVSIYNCTTFFNGIPLDTFNVPIPLFSYGMLNNTLNTVLNSPAPYTNYIANAFQRTDGQTLKPAFSYAYNETVNSTGLFNNDFVELAASFD